MTIKLSDKAIFLHAQALERDCGDNWKLGQIWLETQLGMAIRANASRVGWDLGDLPDADLGGAIWRRLNLILDGLAPADQPDEVIERAVAIQASNLVDEVCIALVCNLGLDPAIAAHVAALRFRRATIDDAFFSEINAKAVRRPD